MGVQATTLRDADPANMDKNSNISGMKDRPQPLTVQTSFSAISIHGGDRLRFINFTNAEIKAITNVIQVSWHKPIQARCSWTSNAYEIKLAGWPWNCSSSSSDSTPSCVLVRDLLAHLFSQGWILSSPTRISSNFRHDDTLIFRRQPTLPPKSEWLAINFGKSDRLRLIGALGDSGFGSLIKGVRASLQDMSYVQYEKAETSVNLKYALHEFKISGNPWKPGSEERVSVTMWLMRLLETLDRFGWSLYASVGHNYSKQGEHDCKKDTWYCVRTVG